MTKVILVTGASSGFGLQTAKVLAQAGHVVYASMRDLAGRNASSSSVRRSVWFCFDQSKISAPALESLGRSVDHVPGVVDDNVQHAGIGEHLRDRRLDRVLSPEQLMEQYDVNVLGTQRLNQAALPHMRERREGLLVWIGSSSTRGGTPPYLGPYFAAKAGMDALAVSYASELARWGIETTIIVPGSFTTGTNHFAHAGKPDNAGLAAEYESGPNKGVSDQALKGLTALSPKDADPEEVGRQVVRVVDIPFGKRPFRVHIDPAQDGAEVVNAVADRMRQDLLKGIGLGDLLSPTPKGGNATK